MDYDLENSIPITEEGGQVKRNLPIDDFLNLDSSRPVNIFDKTKEGINTFSKIPYESTLAGAEKVVEGVNKGLAVLRWPFQRFIEHPLSTMAMHVYYPQGETLGESVKTAMLAYSTKPIPVEKYGSYAKLWNNYYKSITGNDAPGWYLQMASFGTAGIFEPALLAGTGKIGESLLLREATPEEANVIKSTFKPLKDYLEKRGLKTKDLHPEGNIITLAENSELYVNKYLTMVLRGDEIKIPRWWKIDTKNQIVPIKETETLPTTGKEVYLGEPVTEVAGKGEVKNAGSYGTSAQERGQQTQELEQGTEGQVRLRGNEKTGVEATAGKEITPQEKEVIVKHVGKGGAEKPDVEFNPAALEKGVQHEMEHTDSREVAARIAKDHIAENPDYYDILEKTFPKELGKQPSAEDLADYESFLQEYTASEKSLGETVKKHGGIKSFGKGKETEEYLSIPKEYRNKNGMSLDELATELQSEGFSFESGEELRQALISLGKPIKFKISEETKKFLKESRKNKAFVLKVGRELAKKFPEFKVKTLVRATTGQTRPGEPKVTLPERLALRETLKAQVKAAATAEKATREQIFDIQTQMVDVIKNSDLEASDKAKFITVIKNTNTPKKLDKLLPEIEERISVLEQKAEKRSLVEQLKNKLELAENANVVAIDYAKAIKETIEDFDLKKRSADVLKTLQATAEYIKTQSAKGEDVVMPKKVLGKLQILNKKRFEDITNDELRELLEYVQRLEDLGRTKLRVKQEERQLRMERELKELKAGSKPLELKELNKPEIGEKLNAGQNFQNKYYDAMNANAKVEQAIAPMDCFFDLLDGKKNYKGNNFKIIKQPADVSFGKYLKLKDSVQNPIISLIKESNLSDKSMDRIGIYATLQQEGGQEKLLSLGMTEAQLSKVSLTETEMKLYKAMREQLDNLRPLIAQVMKDVYNKDLKAVKEYFPFMTDFEAMSDAEMRDWYGDNVKLFGTGLRKNVEMGFTKERVGGKQKIKINALEVFLQHTDNATYLIEMGDTIKYLGDLSGSPEYGLAVGEYGQQLVREWIDLLARKGRAQGNRIKLLDIIRHNIGMATLGFKLSSALVQPTSLLDAAGFIGKYAFKGATNIANPAWRKFLLDNLPEIKHRVGDDPFFLDFYDKELTAKFINKIGHYGMFPLQKLDGLTAMSTTSGAYEKFCIENNIKIDFANPDQEAINYATLILRRTQASAFFKDLPPAISRGGLTGNQSLDKFILQFQTFLFNRFSEIKHDAIRFGADGGNKGQSLSILFWLSMATLAETHIRRASKEMINYIVGQNLLHKEDSFMNDLAMTTLGNVPFVSDVVSAVAYSNYPVPSIQYSQKLIERMSAAVKGKKTSTRERNAIRALILSLGLFGVPGVVQLDQMLSQQRR